MDFKIMMRVNGGPTRVAPRGKNLFNLSSGEKKDRRNAIYEISEAV